MATRMSVKWYGDRVERAVSDRMMDRMKDAAIEAKGRLKQHLSIPGPPSSAPFNYPHRRSGRLQLSIRYRVYKQLKRIELYSDNAIAGYAKYLEFGTRFMAPRPLFRLLRREMQRIMEWALGRGVRSTRSLERA